MDAAERELLTRIRAALDEMYGERVAQIVLFGSRARGEARPDSDYDLAVFFNAMSDRWHEFHRLADLRVRFLDETGAFLDMKPYLAGAWDDRTPLMHEIRREGIAI